MSEVHDGNELARAAREELARRRRLERERHRNIWIYLGWIGALGWLIVLPAVAGALVGRWLDRILATGVTFAAAGTVLGAGLGLVLAWRRMQGGKP